MIIFLFPPPCISFLPPIFSFLPLYTNFGRHFLKFSKIFFKAKKFKKYISKYLFKGKIENSGARKEIWEVRKEKTTL
jgi:hypothetical protein